MLVEKITRSEILNEDVQLLTDGYSCWVNTADGDCIGRWGRLGVDIHLTHEEQHRQGKQCLECVRGGPWELFCNGMRKHYGVHIPSDFLFEAKPHPA